MRKILFIIPFFLWTCGGGGGSSPTEPEPPQLPTVQNINLEATEDTPKTFTFVGTEPNNLSLTYSISTQPQNGSISISGGSGTYTPNANYNGQDTFLYIATSTSGNSNIGTVLVNIAAVDDEPNTMDVNVTTDEDNSVSITLQAEEYDGDNIDFNITGNPSNGTVTISGSTATYTPNQDWFGTDTFNFEAVDSSSRSIINVATATITVNPINDAPTVDDIDNLDVNVGESIDITLTGSDIENDGLSFSIVDSPNNGTVSISNNIATYSGTTGGVDTFTYKASDGTDDSDTATVTITVTQNFFTFGRGVFRHMVETSDGGVIAVGETYRSGNSNADILIVKIDSNGNEQWNQVIDGGYISSSLDMAHGVVKDSNGDYVVTGQSQGCDVCAGDDGSEVPGGAMTTLSLIKIDESGSIIWNKNDYYGRTDRDIIGNSIIESSNGDYVVFGEWDETSGFQYDGHHPLIQRYSSSGNPYDNNRPTQGTQGWRNYIADNLYYDKGFEEEFSEGVQTSAGSYVGVTYGGSGNSDIVKISDITSCIDGNNCPVDWSVKISSIDQLNSVDEASDGNIVVLGRSFSNGPMLQKVDISSGSTIFEKILFSNRNGSGRSIKSTDDNGFIMTGALARSTVGNALFVMKMDSAGNEEWSKEYSTLGNDDGTYGESIVAMSDGSYIACGQIGQDGDYHAFIIKLDSQGNRIF